MTTPEPSPQQPTMQDDSSPLTLSEPQDSQEKSFNSITEKPILRFFSVTSTTSAWNLFTYLFSCLISVSLLVFINSAQAFVLTDILAVPQSELGDTSGSLAFYDQLLSIILVFCYGFLSDKFPLYSKQFLFSFGFLVISIALFLFPNMPNVYPSLLLARLTFAIGASATTTMLSACLAEYAGESSRGKLAGIVGCFTGLGAIISLFIYLRLPVVFAGNPANPVKGLQTTFYIVASISLLFSILCAIGLRPTLARRQALQDTPISTPIPVYTLALESIKAMKDPRILLGYAGGWVARGDTITLTLFLSLFFAAYYISTGSCPSTIDPTDPSAVQQYCRDAYLKSSTMGGISQTLTLIFSLVFGLACDYLNRSLVFVIASILGAIGYIGMVLTVNPTTGITYLWASLIGISEAGIIVTSLALVTDSTYVPKEYRGSIAGLYSFMGALGILVTTKVGGILFDVIRPSFAFLPTGIAQIIGLLIGIATLIWWYGFEKKKETTSKNIDA